MVCFWIKFVEENNFDPSRRNRQNLKNSENPYLSRIIFAEPEKSNTLPDSIFASCLAPDASWLISDIEVFIDTDGVNGSMRAISLAIQHPDVELIAITTVHGCVKVEQATANVARVQRANLLEKLIPVYMGASDALLRRKSLLMYPRLGTDGIGDRPDLFPQVSPTDFTMHEAESAAFALIRLTTEHDGVTLVCIGPLTNVALAYKIDKNFAKRLQKIVIFGGNHFGSIVCDAAFTECNFGADPEAAKIVMEEMNTPITMVPWEYAYAIGNNDGDIVDFQAHLKINTPLASFLYLATNIGDSATFKHARQDGHGEEIAVAIAINEKAIATGTNDSRLGVELSDVKRGQVSGDFCMHAVIKEYDGSVSDYLAAHPVDQSRSIIHVIIHYDVEKLDEWMHNTVLGKEGPW
ncbi:unnamed protein product [Haemonchus placei]|uniref:IU_nuc_hydro domain-containing protein n=1 Tax=Haemonchus placei TaxID=6290 RepID=A0A0N4WCD2_HAEPC|nr:unnamed protein product [Haemonchus placei]